MEKKGGRAVEHLVLEAVTIREKREDLSSRELLDQIWIM